MSKEPETGVVYAFLTGLTKPSVLSVVLAVFIPFVVTLAAVFAGPRLMASNAYVYLMSHAFDTHTLASHRIMKGVSRNKPTAAILGTSVMVHCVDEGPDLTQTMGLGDEFYVASLPTASQASFEMAAILTELDPYAHSVVVLGLNPGVFTPPASHHENSALTDVVEHPRLAFYSSTLTDEIIRAGDTPPFKTGIYTLDNLNFFLSRRKPMLRNLLNGGIEYGDPLDAPWIPTVNNPEFWEEEKADLGNMIAAYDQNAAAHYDVLARAIQRVQEEPGVRVVVAEAPINPGWFELEDGRDFFNRFAEDLSALAQETGAEFYSLSAGANLTKEDFADYEGHLVTHDAQARCTSAIGESILMARVEL